MKVYLADIPSAIEQVLYRCRQGLRNTFDHKILQVSEPETIDLSFEAVIRKDDLARIETSVRDPSVTTTVTGAQVSTSVRTGAGSTTDSTESSTTIDSGTTTGGEQSADTGGESGSETGAETSSDTGSSETLGGHSSLDSGGEVETYEYETDA